MANQSIVSSNTNISVLIWFIMEYHTSMMLDISFITKYIRPDIITGVHIYILTIPIKISLMKKLPQVKTCYSKFVGICMFANLIKTMCEMRYAPLSQFILTPR